MTDNVDPTANLNEAEKAALAKAEAAGVSVVNGDGTITDLTAKPKPADNATADVNAGTKPAADAGNKPQKPAGVPDKFWNAEKGEVNFEAWNKSTTELEARFTQQQQAAKAPDMGAGDPAKAAAEAAARDAAAKPADQRTPEEKALVEKAEADKTAAAEAAATKARGDAVQAATTEFSKDGKLSDATYQQLAKAGYDKGTVDAYIEGQRAQATLILNSMHEQAGGKSAFEQKVQWGSTVYTAEEQNAFNAALRSGDKGQISLAIQGLNARYSAEFGKSGKQVDTGGGGSGANANAFKTRAELVAAMGDPKYVKGDPSFHREVAERIAASQRAGIDIGIYVM